MKKRIVEFFTPAPDSLVACTVRRGKSSWTDAIHLLWSSWVFITPIFSGYSWRWAIFTLITYPLFIALYAKCCLASQRTSRWYALALVALSLLLLPWYASGLSYFIYGCVMLSSRRLGLIRYMLLLAGLNAAMVAEAVSLGYTWQMWVSIPVTSFIIGLVIHAERDNERKNAELQLSHDEVRRLAALAERERIGRDLHDLLGHTLSLIALKLELSRKLFDRDTEGARREVEEAEKVARHALAEVRSAVSGIRAADLAAELASARLLLESSRVHCSYAHPPADLPDDVERGLSLILREAVTNIARHADATQARIEMERAPASVRLQISDNGRGGIGAEGNGLCGMRERVRVLGGTLAIESPRGGGTRVEIEVPMPVMRPVRPVRSSPDVPSAGALATTVSGHSAA
ncbi:MAG: sensor histidine kinase [Xanthomonadaceae bacterium]|nr:sensor histidine kinase [Xanthomonadaceae bacterium]